MLGTLRKTTASDAQVEGGRVLIPNFRTLRGVGRVLIPNWDAPGRGSRIPNWDAQGRVPRSNSKLRHSGEWATS